MSIQKTPHEWSKESLFPKAQRYAEQMLDSDPSEWQFGFWSAIALEMLVRASLANISPVLVADGKSWNNLLYAVGKTPNQKKFTPKSAEMNILLGHVENTFPEFTKEMQDFGITHTNKRNSELHSGALPFDDVGTSSWLPMYFTVCECLLQEMGESLESFVGEDAANEAREHIQAQIDDAAKSVQKSINAHKTIWLEKNDEQREELERQAKDTATRWNAHRVDCPACKCVAMLHGSASGAPKKELLEDGIEEKQAMRPSNFECIACELKITGYSRLVVCGLGDTFTSTSFSYPSEYFAEEFQEEMRGFMEDDYNE